jgi:hypothetical protein
MTFFLTVQMDDGRDRETRITPAQVVVLAIQQSGRERSWRLGSTEQPIGMYQFPRAHCSVASAIWTARVSSYAVRELAW